MLFTALSETSADGPFAKPTLARRSLFAALLALVMQLFEEVVLPRGEYLPQTAVTIRFALALLAMILGVLALGRRPEWVELKAWPVNAVAASGVLLGGFVFGYVALVPRMN